jgi:hypothetical protein
MLPRCTEPQTLNILKICFVRHILNFILCSITVFICRSLRFNEDGRAHTDRGRSQVTGVTVCTADRLMEFVSCAAVGNPYHELKHTQALMLLYFDHITRKLILNQNVRTRHRSEINVVLFNTMLCCFLCCVFCVHYCSMTSYYSALLFFFCVLYCSLFLYCSVSACDVRAATLTEGSP